MASNNLKVYTKIFLKENNYASISEPIFKFIQCRINQHLAYLSIETSINYLKIFF